MGLLDMFQGEQGMRLGLGLLAAGGPTTDPNRAGLGARLQQGVGYYDDWQKQKAAEERARQVQEFQAFQMEQAKAQMAAQQAEQADALKKRSIFSQNFQSQVGPSADGMGPTRPMQFDHNQAAAQLGQAGFGGDALDLMSKFAPKPADYKVVGDDLLQIGPNGVTPVYQGKKAPAPTDLAKLLAERDQLPEGSQLRRVYDQQITKMTTHQPGVSVSYGAPTAGKDAQGNDVFFQPSKDGSPPSIVQGVTPPAKPMPAELSKSVTGLNELTNALNTYKADLKANGGPAAFATGEKKGKLQGSYTALQMGLKNAFELGALAGPDLELLQGMLVDPTSAKSMIYGKDGVDAQIAQAEKYIKNRGSAVFKANRLPVPKEFEIDSKSFSDFGYKSAEEAKRDGQNAIMRNPANKAEVIKRLKSMGIDTGGM